MNRMVIPLFCAALVFGCERQQTQTEVSSTTNNRAPSAHTEDTEPTAPRAKETQTTAAEELGTLPPDIGIPVGERVPEATVRDADGEEVALGSLLEDGPVLLVFYRGGWCPFCNFQIRQLTEAFPQFDERGVTPVAISVDQINQAAKTRDNYEIPFPVLSDPDLVAHTAFHVVHDADDAEVEKLKGFGMDIEKSSGREHHKFAIPSIFLIDSDGVVQWGHADPDYKVRPSIAQLLAAIDDAELGDTAEE